MSASALRNHANLNSFLVKMLMLLLSASDVSRVIVNLVGMTVSLMEKGSNGTAIGTAWFWFWFYLKRDGRRNCWMDVIRHEDKMFGKYPGQSECNVVFSCG